MKKSATLAFLALLSMNAANADDILREGHMMDASEITAVLPGMTMTGNYGNGVQFTESYHLGGSITYADDEGSDKGRWFVRENLFCTFYDNYNGACFAVRKSGPNCYEYYTAQEEDGSSHSNEGTWNSVGWDSAKPSTCDLNNKTSQSKTARFTRQVCLAGFGREPRSAAEYPPEASSASAVARADLAVPS